ncbi:13869_t:CDS:2 [Dentiscutata erythropus]|uniref:13869_t:CDS:1 n=1 Tax=Dentiscutata erythropus TaxID=1348616 RepID=A0A9N9EWF1_9GLOM|nr:13869_t:CDS:2 [Dentiscutata erythropus]
MDTIENLTDEEFNPSGTESDSNNTNNEEIFELANTVTLLSQTIRHDASKKLSPVWNFMHEKVNSDGTTVVGCDYCPLEYSVKTSTNVLADHLNKQHNCNIILNQKHKSLSKKLYGNNNTQCIEECTISILNFIIVQYMPQISAATSTNIVISASKNKKRDLFKFLLEQQIDKPPLEKLDLYLSSPTSSEDPLNW